MRNILIVAGDLSGDLHAANLAKAIKKLAPETKIYALGGPRLKEAADEFMEDLVKLGTFGFFQPVKQFFRLLGIFIRLKKTMRSVGFERTIVVDYYGFNIHVAAFSKKLGVKTFYFISPQVWATRKGRIKKIRAAVDKMLVILPFEEKLYRDAGVPVEFVGHPLIDMVPRPPAGESGVGHNKPLIGFFPGSRASVFKKHLPILCEAAGIIRSELDCECKLFLASNDLLKDKDCGIATVVESDYKERARISFAISTSGTVSLENALMGVPMVVIYKLSRLNYFVARLLIQIRYITMANILADKALVPELVQDDCTPEKIAKKTLEMLKDKDYLCYLRAQLLDMRKLLGAPCVSERAAEIILSGRTALS
jgi:lipid-A-disaccharide synthase